MENLDDKLGVLKKIVHSMERVVVAFSGGVDSSFLLRVAFDELGDNVVAVTASSVIHPFSELEEAKKTAASIGAKQVILSTDEMLLDSFLANTPERCYHCKKTIFSQLKQWATANRFPYIVEGSNLDDEDDYRPGLRALHELNIRSPLQEAGLSKNEIRTLSKQLGLSGWDKPALACLASRIPYGTRITESILERVDKAETMLRREGFRQVRVRDHGTVARLEVPVEDRERAIDPVLSRRITERLREFGYTYVTLDLEGYRTGSMNETVGKNGSRSD